MIGDKLCDLQCGWAAGVATSILVRTGYGAQLEQAGVEPEGPFHRVHDLPELPIDIAEGLRSIGCIETFPLRPLGTI